jgi:hypothetical protein
MTPHEVKAAAAELQLDITDECAALLVSEPPPVIAAGSSGGKDSDAQAILLDQFLNRIGFDGDRVIIHADLGRIEHAESIDHVRALANFLNWPLIVCKRQKGDLLDRYEQRWRDNCRRYALLECVTLIGPFPSFGMIFCRSEQKVAPIIQTLTKRFAGRTILSCVGIRAQESAARAIGCAREETRLSAKQQVHQTRRYARLRLASPSQHTSRTSLSRSQTIRVPATRTVFEGKSKTLLFRLFLREQVRLARRRRRFN